MRKQACTRTYTHSRAHTRTPPPPPHTNTRARAHARPARTYTRTRAHTHIARPFEPAARKASPVSRAEASRAEASRVAGRPSGNVTCPAALRGMLPPQPFPAHLSTCHPLPAPCRSRPPVFGLSPTTYLPTAQPSSSTTTRTPPPPLPFLTVWYMQLLPTQEPTYSSPPLPSFSLPPTCSSNSTRSGASATSCSECVCVRARVRIKRVCARECAQERPPSTTCRCGRTRRPDPVVRACVRLCVWRRPGRDGTYPFPRTRRRTRRRTAHAHAHARGRTG